MTKFALYLSFGLSFHVVLFGPAIDIASLWTWLFVVSWPLIAAFAVGAKLSIDMGPWFGLVPAVGLVGLYAVERLR